MSVLASTNSAIMDFIDTIDNEGYNSIYVVVNRSHNRPHRGGLPLRRLREICSFCQVEIKDLEDEDRDYLGDIGGITRGYGTYRYAKAEINTVDKAPSGYFTIYNIKMDDVPIAMEAVEILGYDTFVDVDKPYSLFGENLLESSRYVALICKDEHVDDFDVDKFTNLSNALIKERARRMRGED